MNRRGFLQNTIFAAVAAMVGFKSKMALAAPETHPEALPDVPAGHGKLYVAVDPLYGATPIYDADSSVPHFVIDKGQVVQVDVHKRIYVPTFELSEDVLTYASNSRSLEGVAKIATRKLREQLNERLTTLVATARKEDPRVNQVIVSVQKHPTTIADPDGKDTLWASYVMVGMHAYYNPEPVEYNLVDWAKTDSIVTGPCLKRKPETRVRWVAQQICHELFPYTKEG